MPDLSVITVTYCSEQQIERLIRSVQKGCKEISYEHIIVDNGSLDKTEKIIQSFGSSLIFLANSSNLGFSAANLLGYQQSSGKYLLFLNPDMEVEENSLDSIVGWMSKHPETGIAGCRLVDKEGGFNQDAAPRRFPKLTDQFILLLKLQKLFPKSLDKYFYKDLDFSKDQFVDSVRGYFLLMRREFIKCTGWPFDPRYFIWFEDVDICREAWKHGFSVAYTPVINCMDWIGQSFRQRNRSWRYQQYAKSFLCYLRKWEPFYVWCWVPLLFQPLAWALGSKLFSKIKAWKRLKITN